jgi:hypothetical protein
VSHQRILEIQRKIGVLKVRENPARTFAGVLEI